MEMYKDMTIRKKSSLKMLRNLIFFILLIGITYFFIFKDQDMNELINTIKSVNPMYILIAILFMFGVYLSESINIKCILKALGEKNISIFKALKFTLICFFFSAITPAASGGQPVEIYYMNKEGISTPSATMAMMLQLCGVQISILLVGIFCVIINPAILSGGMVWLFILGVVLNSIVLAFMFIGIFSKKITKKLVNFAIKLLKLARVKNIDKKKKKIQEGLAQYNESAIFIKNHKIEFFKSIVRVFIQVLLSHSVPFFVYKAFGLNGFGYIDLLSAQAVLYIMVCSIPLPGSIGVSETVFLNIFGGIFGELVLSSAMLINRFVSFYFFVLLSTIIVIVNGIRTKDIKSKMDKDIDEIDG